MGARPRRPSISSRYLIPVILACAALAAALALLAVTRARADTRPLIAFDFDPDTPGIQTTGTATADGSTIEVDVVIQGATEETGAFEFYMSYENIFLDFVDWQLGPWLGSTGRAVSCQELITENTLRIGCNTSGPEPPGATGDGVLGTLVFRPKFGGQTCLNMLLVETAEVFGHAILTDGQGGCLTITSSSPTPAASATGTGTPTATATPGAATTTPVPTDTPSPTASATGTATATETPVPTATPSPSATDTPGATD
ncbi:MAG TPA: cohesin domain-containing protein, partial [Dehalococcoidia bacterium]|nr:cohesin domain-containing protein [Dehalococcoidia bacterium]